MAFLARSDKRVLLPFEFFNCAGDIEKVVKVCSPGRTEHGLEKKRLTANCDRDCPVAKIARNHGI